MLFNLSHVLDPKGLAWPGEPVLQVKQCTDVTDDCPFCSFKSTLPNHFGTHMDSPRHFVKNGLKIQDLPLDYFWHKNVILLDIPKGDAEGIYDYDLKPYEDILKTATLVLIRTNYEKYKTSDEKRYVSEGPYIAPSAGKYLTEKLDNVKTIGFDFLSVGSPSDKCKAGEDSKACHQNLLGYFTGKFKTAIEDMHLSELPSNANIKQAVVAPLLINNLDSSQVTVLAEVE